MMPVMYNNNYQIVQTEDYVMIQVEMVHDFLIPGMEDSNEPKLALKPPLWITSEHLKCFFDSRKQHCQ